MTSRVRPSRPSQPRARSWNGDGNRRSVLLNLGFGLTVVAAVLLLAAAVGATWYGDHLASAASVNGQSISKDQFRKQLAIDTFRADYLSRRIRTLLTASHLNTTDANARLSLIQQQKQQASAIALEELINGVIQGELATKQGVTVTDADVDARLTEEATTPELRHAWVIEVKPAIPNGASAPNELTKAAAAHTAAQVLADLKAGKDWVTVAKAVTTDTTTKDSGGDIGYVDKDAARDPAFVDAVMAVAPNTPTDVVLGADGIYRIGRVTDVIAPQVDATLQSQLQDDGINVADFRAALRSDVTKTKLSDAILAPLLAAGPHRKVAEIFMATSTSETGPKAIRVRHILYSPKGDPQNASALPSNDPSWADAEAKAKATYAKLQKDPSLFDSIARAESDEGAAKTSGGKLPYFSTDDQIDQAFAKAIFTPGLAPGQLLPPVKSAFGWHVIQVMHGPTDLEWANKLKSDLDSGKLTFADAARDNSDKASAATGGDEGWIGKGTLPADLEKAIFAAPIGKVSDPVQIKGTSSDDGTYLFLVSQEDNRAPDATEKASIEANAFSTWYQQQKATYTITRDASLTAAAS